MNKLTWIEVAILLTATGLIITAFVREWLDWKGIWPFPEDPNKPNKISKDKK